MPCDDTVLPATSALIERGRLVTIRPLTLVVLKESYAICSMDPAAALPDIPSSEFSCLTRTPEELSLVCPEALAPQPARVDREWAGLRVDGPLDFSQVGLLTSLTTPLASAGIVVFVVSTYDTDYLFLKRASLDRATHVLTTAGHVVRGNPT